MASLHRHLTDPDGHDRLAFRADCPRCRARLHGRLDPRVLSPRGEAAAAAGLAAATTLLCSAAALGDSRHPSPGPRAPETPPAVVVDPPGAHAHADVPTPQPRDDEPPPGPVRPAPSPAAGGPPPAELEPAPTVEPAAPPRPEPPAPADPPPAAPAPAQQTPAPTPTAPSPSPPNEPAAARRDDAHTPRPPRTQSRRANANLDQARGDAPSNRRPATEPPRSAPVTPATRPPANDAAAAEQPDALGEPVRHTAADTDGARGRERRPTSVHAAPSSRTAEPAAKAGAPSRERGTHVVRPGECLWTIAERRLGPSASAAQVAAHVDELWRLNAARIGTGNPNLIHAGQTLQLP